MSVPGWNGYARKATVGVEDDLPGQRPAHRDRHRQRGLAQVGAHVVLNGPAEGNPTSAAVADRAEVPPALLGGQIGDVRGPDRVELTADESAVHQVFVTVRAQIDYSGDRGLMSASCGRGTSRPPPSCVRLSPLPHADLVGCAVRRTLGRRRRGTP